MYVESWVRPVNNDFFREPTLFLSGDKEKHSFTQRNFDIQEIRDETDAADEGILLISPESSN
jgi:hypothetical protein